MLITRFLDPGPLVDGDLSLVVDDFHDQVTDTRWAPYYRFRMVQTLTKETLGSCSLRLGNSLHILLYAGHIGYGVEPEHRGNRYAARSVRLLLPLALRHGINPVWITCNPDNLPSRRSCELAGGKLVEIVDIPSDNPMYQMGERRKCRFRWDL